MLLQRPLIHAVFPFLIADYVGVYDARDAIEACGGLWGEEKEACFAIFGVAPQADEWYDLVFSLESVLELDTCKLYLQYYYIHIMYWIAIYFILGSSIS